MKTFLLFFLFISLISCYKPAGGSFTEAFLKGHTWYLDSTISTQNGRSVTAYMIPPDYTRLVYTSGVCYLFTNHGIVSKNFELELPSKIYEWSSDTAKGDSMYDRIVSISAQKLILEETDDSSAVTRSYYHAE